MDKINLSVWSRRLLTLVFCSSIDEKATNLPRLIQQTSLPEDFLMRSLDELASQRLINITKSNSDTPDAFRIRSLGRGAIKVVFSGGVFDIIHPGHIYTLRKSRELGDVLILSVARDTTVLRMKGRRPLNAEAVRREMVSAIESVDLAILGSESNLFETVLRVRPDIISLGYDQKHDEDALQRDAERNGLKIEVVRLGSPIPNLKSSKLVENRDILREI
ncbi:MAG: adenylyltransferase/cytidyltransferase family protein [Nitrososphaerales archaeon]